MGNLATIESHTNHQSHWLGRYSRLKDSNSTTSTRRKKTRVIRISDDLYLKFVEFSQRYYDVVSYSEILENLLKCYKEHNQDTRWYHNTS